MEKRGLRFGPLRDGALHLCVDMQNTFGLDTAWHAPWIHGDLDGRLRRRGVDALIVTSGETDVCVLVTVLAAVDRGYRVVVAEDALCPVSDETYEALLLFYRSRYGCQVETASTAEVLAARPDQASISATSPTIGGAPVAATTASTVTPGAVSRSTRPAGVGSLTAMSATTSVAGRAVSLAITVSPRVPRSTGVATVRRGVRPP